jgi:hypothetical protein
MSPHRRAGDDQLTVHQRATDRRQPVHALPVIAGLFIAGLLAATVWMLATTLSDQREGRRIGIGVTCSAVNAVISGGRHVLETSGHEPPKVEAALHRLGFPPAAVRRAQAARSAQAYATSIAHAVEHQIGGHQRLVRRDGTLDCRRLLAATHAS